MNAGPRNRSLPAGNPLANALVVIVGLLAIGVSLVLGLVAFVVLGSIVLVLAAVLGIRLWWFQRKLRRRQASASAGQTKADSDPDVIEGEFRVVSSEQRRPGRD